jgi:hypothetical protein
MWCCMVRSSILLWYKKFIYVENILVKKLNRWILLIPKVIYGNCIRKVDSFLALFYSIIGMFIIFSKNVLLRKNYDGINLSLWNFKWKIIHASWKRFLITCKCTHRSYWDLYPTQFHIMFLGWLYVYKLKSAYVLNIWIIKTCIYLSIGMIQPVLDL